jgi:hypothetical protein
LEETRFCLGWHEDYKTNNGAKATGSEIYFFSKLANAGPQFRGALLNGKRKTHFDGLRQAGGHQPFASGIYRRSHGRDGAGMGGQQGHRPRQRSEGATVGDGSYSERSGENPNNPQGIL